MAKSERAEYGIDAPPVIRNFALIAAAGILLLISAFQFGENFPRAASIVADIAVAMIFMGGINVPLMILSSTVGKFYERDRLIASLSLRGNEQVLDVGCGRGLLLIAVAKKLNRGKATGIDIWQTEDQSGNDPEVTKRNAAVENVSEKVDIRNGDARRMPFADGSFDVVVSSLAIHNIYDQEGRKQAIREIFRVLKPGGKVALLDIKHTGEYADAFRQAGMKNVQRSGLHFFIFPPVRVVSAEK